jgi:hypothetical protein
MARKNPDVAALHPGYQKSYPPLSNGIGSSGAGPLRTSK